MMIAGAVFVVLYTFVGGFLAESASDFLQGVVMIFALTAVLVFGISHAGGISAIIANAESIPGFIDFFGMAQPQVVDGIQQIGPNGQALFDDPIPYGLLSIISTLSWGLGYFGMPHVLLKFMAINKPDELTMSRRIAVVWVIISLTAAVGIGIIGRVLFPAGSLLKAKQKIFCYYVYGLFVPFIAGIVWLLAATISSSDSYLLIAASALSKIFIMNN